MKIKETISCSVCAVFTATTFVYIVIIFLLKPGEEKELNQELLNPENLLLSVAVVLNWYSKDSLLQPITFFAQILTE